MKGMPDCEDCDGRGWYWLLMPNGTPVSIEDCYCIEVRKDMNREKRLRKKELTK